MKLCNKCHIKKDTTNFYKKNTKDGYTYFCKECIKDNISIYKKINKDKIKIFAAKYYNLNKIENRQKFRKKK